MKQSSTQFDPESEIEASLSDGFETVTEIGLNYEHRTVAPKVAPSCLQNKCIEKHDWKANDTNLFKRTL